VVNADLRVGGCMVRAGDWIVGDDDGLAVLDAAALVGLIDKAEAKLALESDWTAALAKGQLATDVFGLN
jgi:4-hydroxy-4-methyl-2-oxoglutarate aldolase